MHPPPSSRLVGVLVLGLLAANPRSEAQEAPAPDRVVVREGKLLMFQEGRWLSVETTVRLSEEIQVQTNLTFVVGKGKERKLEEGQLLGKDGYLTSNDGRVEPVFDHVAMKDGRVLVVREGVATAVTEALSLGDGSQVRPEGYRVAADGRRWRLLDGQWYRLNGAALPAVDTATLREGKVYVQKDGSTMPIAAGRTMMMSEGSKVHGDGTVTKRDGTRLTLPEGQVVQFEGVVVRSR